METFNMKNKLTSAIILLLTLVCTIIAYYLLFEIHSKLFYINMITTCIAEVILLANIPILSNGKWLNFKNVAITTILNTYVITLVLWTSIYSLYIEDEKEYRILYIGMLTISIIFIVLLGSTALGGGFMKTQEQSFHHKTRNKKAFLISPNAYWLEIRQTLQAIKSDWKDNTLHDLRIVLDKVSVISSVKLENNPDVADEINVKLNEIKEKCMEISNDEENHRLQEEATLTIEQFKNYITAIKSSL